MNGSQLKISIIGIGRVGSSIAFSVMLKGLAGEMILVSRNREKALGEACDLVHAGAFARPVTIRAGEFEDTADSDIVIISASVPMVDMKNRLDLGAGNKALFESIVPQLARYSPQAIFVIVTNPVDIMTYLTLRLTELPAARVIGTGTLIDSGRFRRLLGDLSGIHPDDIHAYILGEHGESEFPALSLADVGGEPMGEVFPVCVKNCSLQTVRQVFEQARQGGIQVYQYKGYTNHAIALATTHLIESIAGDLNRIMPVSTLIDGYLGVRGMCLSLPAVIGRTGIRHVLQLNLAEDERHEFQESARILKEAAHALGIGQEGMKRITRTTPEAIKDKNGMVQCNQKETG